MASPSSFARSKAEQAYDAVFELAGRHGLGLFDVSSSQEAVWLPNDGKLNLAHLEIDHETK